MRACHAQHGGVVAPIYGAGEARRHGAEQDPGGALASLARDGETHARAEPRRPAVHDDHAFWREQRAVHEGAVARLFDVAREEALERGECAGTREIENSDTRGRDDRTGAQPVHDLDRHVSWIEPRNDGRRGGRERLAHASVSLSHAAMPGQHTSRARGESTRPRCESPGSRFRLLRSEPTRSTTWRHAATGAKSRSDAPATAR